MTVPSALTARRLCRLGLCCLFAAGSAGAATFRVGIGTGCTHLTVESAVAAAAANGSGFDEIKIAHVTQTLGSLVDVDSHSVALVGGFSSCTAVSPTGQTTLRRFDPTDAFYVHSAAGTAVFSLERITVDMGASAKRALRLDGNVQAILIDSVLTDGQAPLGEDGGNVWMSGNATLALIGSEISLGTASEGAGGGVYCENGGTVFVDIGSVLQANESQSGGGIHSVNCTLEIRGRIHDNNAFAGSGGGIYAGGGSSVSLFGPGIDDFYVLSSNLAEWGGAGVYLAGAGTTAIARNVWIGGNIAGASGGGVDVSTGATFTMDVDPQTCPSGRVPSGRSCSEFFLNRVEGSSPFFGGGAIDVSGSATLRQTGIWGNSGYGAVASVGGSLVLEGCGIEGNDRIGIHDVEPLPRRRVADDRFLDHRRAHRNLRRLPGIQRSDHPSALEHRAGGPDLLLVRRIRLHDRLRDHQGAELLSRPAGRC